mmetsp:Transcript_34338/g.68230  ORF Transcript_34338/g.68230 Transcript_34338/m.68230 type:complete len:205 (+) Transcript_34338:763-1377(+)
MLSRRRETMLPVGKCAMRSHPSSPWAKAAGTASEAASEAAVGAAGASVEVRWRSSLRSRGVAIAVGTLQDKGGKEMEQEEKVEQGTLVAKSAIPTAKDLPPGRQRKAVLAAAAAAAATAATAARVVGWSVASRHWLGRNRRRHRHRHRRRQLEQQPRIGTRLLRARRQRWQPNREKKKKKKKTLAAALATLLPLLAGAKTRPAP